VRSYLFHAGRISFPVDKSGDEVQNFLLSLRQLHLIHLFYTGDVRCTNGESQAQKKAQRSLKRRDFPDLRAFASV
jgi:hypothetical protein